MIPPVAYGQRAGVSAARGRFPTLCLAALMLALAGCSQMPLREGPRAALLPGIETPRDRDEIEITIHELPVTAWGKCLEVVGASDPLLAVMSVMTLSPMHACARVARDRDLAPGQKPWCIVAVPEGDQETLEHELRHCEGWDHPRNLHAEAQQAKAPHVR